MAVTLHPFAAHLKLLRPVAADSAYWRELITRLLEAIARRAMAADAVLVGHIKAIALFDGHCLHGNCVSQQLPPQVHGELPLPVKELELDLAVLVYGIEWEALRGVVEAASREVCAALACTPNLEARRNPQSAHGHAAAPAHRPKLLCCKVMLDEMRAFLPANIAVEAFEISLHVRPTLLRETLQAAVDAADGIYDPIILGYGMCSKATVGLVARRSRLVVPKNDDCIGIFLGSDRARREEADREPGTYFLTRGWIGDGVGGPLSEYEHMVARFGPEKAELLLGKMMSHYKRLAYICAPGTEPPEADRAYAQAMAGRLGMQYVEIAGSASVFARAGEMRWEEDFIVTQPGQPIALESFLN